MRKLVAATLAACLLLCGCGGNGIIRDESNNKLNTGGRFLCDSSAYLFETVVDTHTGVTYLVWTSGSGNASKGGITVLLNSDGTPVISEEVSR